MGWREDYDKGRNGTVTPFWERSQWTALGEQDRAKENTGVGGAGAGLLLLFLGWLFFGHHTDQSNTVQPRSPAGQNVPYTGAGSNGNGSSGYVQPSPIPASPNGDNAPATPPHNMPAPENASPAVVPAPAPIPAPDDGKTADSDQSLDNDLGCTVPVAPVAIDGATATREQMDDALTQVKAFLRDSSGYQDCLNEKSESNFRLRRKALAAIDAMQVEREQVGNKFNEAAHTFNARTNSRVAEQP